MATKVEWADETWNPWAGCTKISPGCENCCALGFARRLQGQGHPKYAFTTKDGEWTGRVNFRHEELEKPSHWRKPRRIFTQIMGDIAHSSVHPLQFGAVWRVMRKASWHTFILLTKRPASLKQLIDSVGADILPNVWLGVTVEDQEQAEKRIPLLLQIPAAVLFVSCEPLLEFVGLNPTWLGGAGRYGRNYGQPQIDWVIAGPENGPGKRPCDQGWLQSLYCDAKCGGVPFFDKRKENWIAREYPA